MANTTPTGCIPVANNQGGSSGALVATLGANANAGRCVYLTGFEYQASGATSAAVVTITISYAPVSGSAVTLAVFGYPIPAGATTIVNAINPTFIPPFSCPVPLTGVNNSTTSTPAGSISINASAAGSGASFATITCWGYLQ